MEMTYSKDVERLDEPIFEAAHEQKPGETIRIRIQPSIFRRLHSQHRMWPGLSWTIDCQDTAEAIALREALRAFFEAVVRVGPAPLITELNSLDPPA
jgi:hypothetical protein